MNEFLVYFSYKYLGDWDAIYEAIRTKEKIDSKQFDDYLKYENIKTKKYITILDSNFPKEFNSVIKPPFAIYYHGNLDILSNECERICLTGNYETNESLKILANIDFKTSEFIFVTESWSGFDSKIVDKLLANNQKIIIVLSGGIDWAKQYLDSKYLENDNVLILSEYPHFYHPIKKSIFARNRIVAALANKLVLISSTKFKIMPLVNAFLENGKNVFCFSDNTQNNDNIALINDGAQLITSINDIVAS
ncbi:DNA-processing protein DprA [Metamycoplasma equirhinis]|uniref:DNA-processing protein DprA n=1 Tax=Metamycoplasma equirhinis TaxID=92402 RepID=UPI00359388CD